METLQEILEKSKIIDYREYWKHPDNHKEVENYFQWEYESFRKCFFDKWNIEDIYQDTRSYLILVIEKEKVVRVGFTGYLYKWFSYYTMYDRCENLRLYIKDLTNENITYDNFRQYKREYIEKFVNAVK